MLIALVGIAAIPAVSDAIQPFGQPTLKVTVKPRSGSPATHFVISFTVGGDDRPGRLG